jgi:magnesium chelatase subunit ChlD-like protein
MGETFQPRKLNTPLDKLSRKHAGRRSLTRTERKHGRYIKARPAGNKTDDIAFDATLRAAAPFQKRRVEKRKRLAFAIEKSDLQRKVRVKRVANLVLFVVDASWSMAVSERMNATKGAILSLLTDAYQRRDRVGLIVFQKDRATLILPPTNSVQLAQRALMDIPVGGKTPLSAGLLLATDVLQHEKHTHPDVEPLLIVLTDGAGNVSIGALPPQEESLRRVNRTRGCAECGYQHGTRSFRPGTGATTGKPPESAVLFVERVEGGEFVSHGATGDGESHAEVIRCPQRY